MIYIYTGARVHSLDTSPQCESPTRAVPHNCHPNLSLKLLDFITAVGWRRRGAARPVVPTPVASPIACPVARLVTPSGWGTPLRLAGFNVALLCCPWGSRSAALCGSRRRGRRRVPRCNIAILCCPGRWSSTSLCGSWRRGRGSGVRRPTGFDSEGSRLDEMTSVSISGCTGPVELCLLWWSMTYAFDDGRSRIGSQGQHGEDVGSELHVG